MNTPFPPVRRADRSAAGPDGRGRVVVTVGADVLDHELPRYAEALERLGQ